MKKLATLAISAVISVAASATGILGDSHDTNNTNINTPTANAGASASAGAVGVGVGVGIGGTGGEGGKGGAGGSVLGSGNSSNTNLNANLQGQQQGQGQSQSNRSSNENTNRSSNSNSNSATGGVSGSSSGSNSGGNTTSLGNSVGQAVSVDARNQSVYQAQERNPVNSAYSASLTSSNGTCMGSSSFGATGPGFSATVGSTWKDSDCSKRYTAEALRAAGLNSVAMGVLCQIPDVKAAAPKQCDATAKLLGSIDEDAPKVAVVAAPVAVMSSTDPYIAARMAKK